MILHLHPKEIDRLARHAKAGLAAQVRSVDEDSTPEHVIGLWIDSLPDRDVPLPIPSAEPGDLLVKLARAEFWTFTVHGWRELAPIELVDVDGWGSPLEAPTENEPKTYEIPEPDVIVLLEEASAESRGSFPSWVHPVFCAAGTVGPPIVIRREFYDVDPHPESLDVDREIGLEQILDEDPAAFKHRIVHHWPPTEADHQDGMRRARTLAEEALDRIVASDEPTLDGRGGARMRRLGSVRFTDVPGGINMHAPPWEPDEPQQQILDELAEQADQLTAALDTISAAPFGLDQGRMELAAYRAGINRARLLVRDAMRRLYA